MNERIPSKIGIVMLDTVFPRIVGDIGNPGTFGFPVIYEVVKGASPARVVKEADPSLLEPFIRAAQRLEERGAAGITTSCGFLAVFQTELAAAVSVPFFGSSLLQVHMARALMKPGRVVGILTCHRASLTGRHLAGVGIDGVPCVIAGLDDSEEFVAVFLEGKRDMNEAMCRLEVVGAARSLVEKHPEVGAVVLECTNMPPYADDVRRATGLPVFDAKTMVDYLYAAIGGRWW